MYFISEKKEKEFVEKSSYWTVNSEHTHMQWNGERYIFNLFRLKSLLWNFKWNISYFLMALEMANYCAGFPLLLEKPRQINKIFAYWIQKLFTLSRFPKKKKTEKWNKSKSSGKKEREKVWTKKNVEFKMNLFVEIV